MLTPDDLRKCAANVLLGVIGLAITWALVFFVVYSILTR